MSTEPAAADGVVVSTTDPLDPPGTAGVATATAIGRSRTRHAVGVFGQYALLVALAAVVLVPLLLTLIQALSPPSAYLEAGKPLHPVAVDWKDRTWFTGGFVSVLLRTLAVLVILALVQLKAAGGGVRDVALLKQPRRLVAVVGGLVVMAGLSTPIFAGLYHRWSTTVLWILWAMIVVAATQFIGFVDAGRRLWVTIVYAASFSAALVLGVVVAVGAETWTRGWDGGDLGPAMVRSLVVTVLITGCQLLTSILGAYAFAFLGFPFKNVVFALFVATMLLPLEVTLLANVQTIRELDWINTNQALVLPFAATAFGTFLIRQGFRAVPPEIQDATRLDGYGHLAFLWKFAVPLTRPVIASFTVISALGAWNQYLWPQAVIDSDTNQTAQIRLRSIVGTEISNANTGIAAALLVAVPVVLLLIAFQRQIIRGLTAGAVKG
jgi:sn-glycerol 3-phosphate transport system permease protein